MEGDLVKVVDGTGYGDNDPITLTNNAIMYLFSKIKYSLGGMDIESLNHPGFATSMLGLLKYSLDYANGSGLVQCWYPDASTVAAENNVGFAAPHNYIVKKTERKGSFSFAIPLEHIFGFCENYDKVTLV